MDRQSLFNFALKAFLLLSPIFYFGSYKPSFAQGMFFIFASFVLFGIAFSLEPRRKLSNPWLSLFLLWAFISIFVGEGYASNQEWFNFWWSSANFIYVFCAMLLFYVVYTYVKKPESYLMPILIVCTMNFILVSAQLLGHDFMWKHTPSICGFMGLCSQLGQYSAMAMPIVAFMHPLLIAIPLFTLFVSKSISSIIAVFCGAIFLSWQFRKVRLIVLLIVLGLCLGASNYKYILYKWNGRPKVWEQTLKVALQTPYRGSGYDSFTKKIIGEDVGESIGARELRRAHCDPLHTAQEIGFPAVIIIGGFFISLGKRFQAKADKDKLTYLLAMSILIVLINGMGQTLIRYANVAGTFVVLLAFLTIKLEE